MKKQKIVFHIEQVVAHDTWEGYYFGCLVATGKTKSGDPIVEVWKYDSMYRGEEGVPSYSGIWGEFEDFLREKYPGSTMDTDL